MQYSLTQTYGHIYTHHNLPSGTTNFSFVLENAIADDDDTLESAVGGALEPAAGGALEPEVGQAGDGGALEPEVGRAGGGGGACFQPLTSTGAIKSRSATRRANMPRWSSRRLTTDKAGQTNARKSLNTRSSSISLKSLG